MCLQRSSQVSAVSSRIRKLTVDPMVQRWTKRSLNTAHYVTCDMSCNAMTH